MQTTKIAGSALLLISLVIAVIIVGVVIGLFVAKKKRKSVCGNCGTQLRPGAGFCENCGRRV